MQSAFITKPFDNFDISEEEMVGNLAGPELRNMFLLWRRYPLSTVSESNQNLT